MSENLAGKPNRDPALRPMSGPLQVSPVKVTGKPAGFGYEGPAVQASRPVDADEAENPRTMPTTSTPMPATPRRLTPRTCIPRTTPRASLIHRSRADRSTTSPPSALPQARK